MAIRARTALREVEGPTLPIGAVLAKTSNKILLVNPAGISVTDCGSHY